MFSPSAFVVDDTSILHDVIRAKVFVTLAAVIDGAVQFAYAPMMVDPDAGPLGGILYHLSAANPLARLDGGAQITMTLIAADTYVSPDWYRTTITVPTWNYIAVEGVGAARRTSPEELRQLVIYLSAQEEAKLLPKQPWLLDKVPPERTEVLLNGIVGFSLPFERLQGKFKLSQDKTPEDIAGVIAELEARGDVASLAVARAMKKVGT